MVAVQHNNGTRNRIIYCGALGKSALTARSESKVVDLEQIPIVHLVIAMTEERARKSWQREGGTPRRRCGVQVSSEG